MSHIQRGRRAVRQKALQILHGMGMSTSFGGSVGSALPQRECMVIEPEDAEQRHRCF